MADFMIGKGGSGKDRFMVGWNESKQNKSAYKVGTSASSPSQSNKSVGGDQDPVVGSKSDFSYKEIDAKDVGDRSPNMNLGGEVSSGTKMDPTGTGGQLKLEYAEKGDWEASSGALSRRKASLDQEKKYYGANSEFDTPTASIISVKKG